MPTALERIFISFLPLGYGLRSTVVQPKCFESVPSRIALRGFMHAISHGLATGGFSRQTLERLITQWRIRIPTLSCQLPSRPYEYTNCVQSLSMGA